MTRFLKALTTLLFVIAIVNAGRQSYVFYTTFSPFFKIRDLVWQIDNGLAQTRNELLAMKVERIGYRIAPSASWEQKLPDRYWIQYAVAPIVVRQSSDNAGEDWVMMNYSPDIRPFFAPDLACVEDFGNGIALHKKTRERVAAAAAVELGSVWHEQEGPYRGTWTRRGLTDTFDAEWTGPGGERITDEIRFESAYCGRVILYRKGTKGRYHGKLSRDGTRVENGNAQWLNPAHGWSATIAREP
jgi:hypothetical protein